MKLLDCLLVIVVAASCGTEGPQPVTQVDLVPPPKEGSLTGTVIARDALPAVGAVVHVDLSPVGFISPDDVTTDVSGTYVVPDVPNVPEGVDVTVLPWDENADGEAEYAALTQRVVLAGSTRQDFDLRLTAQALMLISSNVDGGQLDRTATFVYLTFNQPIALQATHVVLEHLDTGLPIAVWTDTWPLTTGFAGFSVDIPGSPLAYGAYSLTVDAVAVSGASATFVLPFTVTCPGVMASDLPPVSGLSVSPFPADFGTHVFSASWSPVDGAAYYSVYGRTSRYPHWFRAAKTGETSFTLDFAGWSALFWAPTSEDRPSLLGYGTVMDLAVVPADTCDGEGAIDQALVVSEFDGVAPTVAATQLGSADNSAGAASTSISLMLQFSEPMDLSTLPAISLPVGGMTATALSFEKNHTRAFVTITVPAGVDGSGLVTLSGGEDTSGNAMAPSSASLSHQQQLVVDGGFESGSLDLAHASGLSSISLASVTSSVVATGQYAMKFDLLLYDLPVVPQASRVTLSFAYETVNEGTWGYSCQGPTPSSSIIWDNVDCQLVGTRTYPLFHHSYTYEMDSFATVVVDLTDCAGCTEQLRCLIDDSCYRLVGYLDDLSLVVTE